MEVGDGGAELIIRRQCAWCNAVKVRGVYRRCPAIPKQDRVADNTSHGICPSCLAELQADMGRMLD